MINENEFTISREDPLPLSTQPFDGFLFTQPGPSSTKDNILKGAVEILRRKL